MDFYKSKISKTTYIDIAFVYRLHSGKAFHSRVSCWLFSTLTNGKSNLLPEGGALHVRKCCGKTSVFQQNTFVSSVLPFFYIISFVHMWYMNPIHNNETQSGFVSEILQFSFSLSLHPFDTKGKVQLSPPFFQKNKNFANFLKLQTELWKLEL